MKLAGRPGGDGSRAARAHLRYLQRDGVSKENEAGKLYGAGSDGVDGKAFLDRSQDDRHQFRFIVSPEDAVELEDLKPFVRDLMRTMEKDLGTKLDWVAVDHFNTAQPHTHILLRGRDDQGEDLVIARDYIGHGMRRRASELLTLELGPQTEQETRRKLEQQVNQDRFTGLDQRLLRQAKGGLLELHTDRHTGERHTYERNRQQTLETGRLKVLERRGLAQELSAGRWQLSPVLETTLRRAGERGDIIKTMHRGLKAAGLDVGASDYAIFDPSDPRTKKVTGLIIDRGLHNEFNDGHYILVDGADSRVHYIALDPCLDMEDLPLGGVVEVEPARNGSRKADRTIAEIAKQNGGKYAPELHRSSREGDPEEVIKAHVRRLEALRRQGVVQRHTDGSWKVPDDFEERVIGLGANLRFPSRVRALSYLSLEAQTCADGATWLDRHLVAEPPLPMREGRFGDLMRSALKSRQDYLIDEKLAERHKGRIRYRRNLLQFLRQRDLVSAGARLSKETGLEFVETSDGGRAEGVYKRSVKLASGRFAVLEKSKEFTLVPWRPVLERYRDKTISGRLRGASMSFEVSRKRSLGIG